MGASQENELILVNVLQCFYDSISMVLRKNVEKKSLIDHMDSAMLVIDELCDNGLVLWLYCFINAVEFIFQCDIGDGSTSGRATLCIENR